MPIYDFYCSKCKETIELIAPMNDTEKVHSCGSKLTRLISVPRIKFIPNVKDKMHDYLASDESRYLTPEMKQIMLKDVEGK